MSNPLHAMAGFLIRRKVRGAFRFHAWACGGAPLEAFSKHGIKLRLDPIEYVSGQVLHRGYYEEEVLDALVADIRPDDVFWDIGACLGIHALTVAKFHPTVRVSAFEPNPAMARLIVGAAGENGVRVEVLPYAMGASEGPVEFYVEKGNAGRSGLDLWGHSENAEKIRVELTTADALVAAGRLPSPTLVKLDVEGSELDVLRGMAALLRGRGLRRIVFEDGPGTEGAIKTLLAAAGFGIRQLERREATHHPLENFVATR